MRFSIFRQFLWGYVKAHDNTYEPASVEVLEDNIGTFIGDILWEMLERVCRNWTKQMEHLKLNSGQHLHEIFYEGQL